MKDNQPLEEQIRNVLASETDAISLSDKLFGPDGLFNQSAKTETERRAVAQSPLFKEAQRRFSELKRNEAETFSKAIEQSKHGSGGALRLVKIERV